MKYATIPIFGATFYTGSWFGVPVQWNGLDYACACLELASHDTSLPWRQIGEGITISGMNQQSVRALDYGTYTDNWNLVTNAECVVCMLAPGGILANVFRLLGVSHIAGVDGVVTGSGWIAVNGPGSVSDARLSGDNLTARAAHFTGEVGTVAIMPVVKPQRVTVDGTAYEECRTGSPNPGQWKYSARLGLVTVAIRFGDRPATVSASGIARLELVSNQTEWRFDEAGEALGWIPASDLSPPTAADGALRMEITGGDPYFVSPPFGVSAASVTGVAICARLSKPGGEVFWGNRAGGPAAAREVPFDLPADGSFHEVYVDLTGHPEWRGAITQVRVDFNGGPGDTVELKWVKVVKREAR